jgi:hypothetical protein
MKVLLVAGAVWSLVLPIEPGESPAPPAAQPHVAAAAPSFADVFQYPLPEWVPNCLGFGSEWRYCNGTPLRSCPAGAVWLHTGVDITTGIQPVMAAGDGVIIGYLIDPQFRGGVLIRHQTSAGVVITQYWHVWLRYGFGVDYEPHAWNGALPPAPCSGFPAFPYRFVEPNAFIEAHLPPVRFARGVRL